MLLENENLVLKDMGKTETPYPSCARRVKQSAGQALGTS